MRFFIDTANVDEIREANEMGIICGVTTNPSLIAKEGRDFNQVIAEIASIVDGPISGEVKATTTDAETMIKEAREIAKIHPNMVVKIPMTSEGLKAVKVVTALARFFRISLSRGKSIIPVKDELEHVRNYLMIQQMRFKNKFIYQIEAEPEVLSLASLKLMLQPLVENAIYHGMEFMDGDGEIVVKAWRQEGNLRFTIEDNGLGMTAEQAAGLLTGRTHGSSRRGSGIGVKNVNERIRLYFGEEYGLVIWSEPDEGTKVEICLPAVPFEKLAEEDKP